MKQRERKSRIWLLYGWIFLSLSLLAVSIFSIAWQHTQREQIIAFSKDPVSALYQKPDAQERAAIEKRRVEKGFDRYAGAAITRRELLSLPYFGLILAEGMLAAAGIRTWFARKREQDHLIAVFDQMLRGSVNPKDLEQLDRMERKNIERLQDQLSNDQLMSTERNHLLVESLVKQKEEQENLLHQLRSAVSSIGLASDLLWEQESLEEEDGAAFGGESIAAAISTQVQRAEDMLCSRLSESTQMLPFSYYFEPVRLSAVFHLALEYAGRSELLQEQPDRLQTDPFIMADSLLLAEALSAVLDNAADAASPEHPVRIWLQENEGTVMVCIENDILLPEGVTEQTENVEIERYKTTRRKEGHFGIGMHLARKVVSDHKGDLIVKNHDKTRQTMIVFSKSAKIF